jgi:protoheme ferro-lyase
MTGGTSQRERVLILVLTYGEPPEARFGPQFRYSLSILRRLTRKVAPIPRPILPLIAVLRGRTRVKTWRAENFSSPLERITEEQVASLAAVLRRRDPSREYDVRVVYEFRPPLLPEVFDGLAADPPDRLLLMPMYLPDSDFTTGISQDDVSAWERRRGQPLTPAPELVGEFSEDEAVVDLMVRSIEEQLAKAGISGDDCRGMGLLLGAHGTLIEAPEGMNTGLESTQHFLDRLSERLAPRFAHTSVGWLNHTLGGEWTSPDLATAAAEMVARGLRRVVHYPFGFLADNAETQLEGRVILRGFDALEPLHMQCLNAWPPFVEHLAERVMRKLAESAPRVAVA